MNRTMLAFSLAMSAAACGGERVETSTESGVLTILTPVYCVAHLREYVEGAPNALQFLDAFSFDVTDEAAEGLFSLVKIGFVEAVVSRRDARLTLMGGLNECFAQNSNIVDVSSPVADQEILRLVRQEAASSVSIIHRKGSELRFYSLEKGDRRESDIRFLEPDYETE